MALTRLNKKNLRKGSVPNRSGVYTLYNNRGTPIYTGTSKVLRHRLQSYVQKDDLQEHHTKRGLRSRAEYFSYRRLPIEEARRLEHERKKKLKYNYL